MCVIRFLLSVFILCLLYISAVAQSTFSDTIFQIQEVHVYANLRDAHAIGATIQTIDTISLKRFNNRSISDLLNTNGVNIKSYGLGGLSTLAMRGGGASHTTIVWNGLNIQNPMNGSSNLSLLPVNMFNSVRLQYGGSGTLYGSGAVTGILHLTSGNSINQPNKISTTVGYGSGNTRNISANAKWGTNKYSISIKSYLNKANNNFEFLNSTKIVPEKEKITNAEASQNGLLGDFGLKLSNSLSWSLSSWYQYNNKNLQTLMDASMPSTANQIDKNFLLSSNLRWAISKVVLLLKNGWIDGKIKYSNPQYGEFSKNRFITSINELEAKIPIKSFSELVAGINYTNDFAVSEAYLMNKQRNRVSMFGSYRVTVFNNKLNATLSLRDEIVDGESNPFIFSLGADYSLVNAIKVKTSISRNYRIPTFNDLYWAPSTFAEGNLDLKPEYGWSGEFGLEFSKKTENSAFTLSSTTFWTDIDNCITWLSDPTNMGKWKPYNIDNIKTKGMESRADWRLKFNKLYFSINGFYTYTHSRIYGQKNYNGKPLIYVPKHKFSGSIQIYWNGFGISYSHLFNDERFKDYTNTLSYFNIGDVNLEYSVILQPTKLNFRFSICNIWNTDYQLIAGYAMPLRNYMLALTIDINQPKN